MPAALMTFFLIFRAAPDTSGLSIGVYWVNQYIVKTLSPRSDLFTVS
jgi:hypothetical protein